MEPRTTIRLLIADDHALLRSGLRTVLQKLKKDGIEVAAEAASGAQAIQQAELLRPHIILMDVEMPGIDGAAATVYLKEHYPEIGIIALSGYNEASVVMDMLSAGAEGYLLKDTTVEEMKQAILTVYAGGTYYTPAIHPHLKKRLEQARNKYSAFPVRPLTEREKEVLRLICSGKSSKEIGANLGLSKRTIDSYREKIMAKTGAKNSIDMLQYAVKHRLYKIS